MSRVPIRLPKSSGRKPSGDGRDTKSPSSVRVRVPAPKESEIQRTIMEGLTALRIWHVRMNSGAMFAEHGGKKRMLRFGRKGMADILAVPVFCLCGEERCKFGTHLPTWLEVKRPGENQTDDQSKFQVEVEAEGHRYATVHSWEEALEVLNGQ